MRVPHQRPAKQDALQIKNNLEVPRFDHPRKPKESQFWAVVDMKHRMSGDMPVRLLIAAIYEVVS